MATRVAIPTKIYQAMIRAVDPEIPAKIRPLWEHPAGPKTVFFWAPLFKWGLIVAGLADIARPASTLSVSQAGSLFATGVIWSRYSLVIIPKNYGLFSVNLFVAITQFAQLCRAYNYQMELKSKDAIEASPIEETADKSKTSESVQTA